VVLYLLESAGVAVVAGTTYGLSPYFRLSIATSIETLMEGAERIAQAVADLAGPAPELEGIALTGNNRSSAAPGD
jgi:hypothetical protein